MTKMKSIGHRIIKWQKLDSEQICDMQTHSHNLYLFYHRPVDWIFSYKDILKPHNYGNENTNFIVIFILHHLKIIIVSPL